MTGWAADRLTGACCTSGLFRFGVDTEGCESFFDFLAAAFWAFQFGFLRSDSNEFIKLFFTIAAFIRINRHP